MDVHAYFGLDPDRVWLNTSHQGALPLAAAAAARQAVDWKLQPHRMTTERFGQVPSTLKDTVGRLVDVPGQEVILTNGASYGLHLLANGLPLAPGDEVVLMAGDFPSNLLPWRAATQQGVRVRQVQPEKEILSLEEVEKALSPRTKLVCLSWVHSFSGRVLDIAAIGALCRRNGTSFAVNASQALGVRPLHVQDYPVDALFSVGWKWLCGPYGTGFAWLRRSLWAKLRYNQAYWLAAQNEASLRGETGNFTVPPPEDARRYDVFGTANFFNFMPLAVSIDYLLDVGIDSIAEHVRGLVDRLIDGLDTASFELISAGNKGSRSSLVVFRHKDAQQHIPIHRRLAAAGIDVALRKGRLRISPHLYNTPADIDRALTVLHQTT